jgi:hypothetical protein
MLALMACAPVDSARLPPTEVPATAPDTSDPGRDEAVEVVATAAAAGLPYACPGTIEVPRSPGDPSPAAAADGHRQQWGAAPAPARARLGFGADPATMMSVSWTTDAGTEASAVQLGRTPTLGAEVLGASFELGSAADDLRVHEVRLCGLEPDTTYLYRVGGAGHWSATWTFTTAPQAGTEGQVVFGVAGDTRGDPVTWRAVSEGMAEHGAQFILFSGDAVTSGSVVSEWKSWLDAGVGTLESLPLVFAMGNHEAHHENWYGLVTQPGNERWFSLDYGPVHVVTLCDTDAGGEWDPQADWLKADLAAATARWKLGLHHQPLYASSVVSGADATTRAWFRDPLEAGGLAIDFTGHAHRYERSVPLRREAMVPASEGTTYVVSGGGGAPLYEESYRNWYTAVEIVTNHYLVVVVEGSTASVTAYDLAGNVIDAFGVTR